ncbi:hypothetical protein GDO86_013568 [Hymenochirus boettgeri]|uniref:Olfactory receptor n=1 Tax=Hymenochirus boettgeri TaxID=247094 RepID=A0A8T2IX78_9PIPI|nr:hypothetical protein GDO86_013568 [Hymenochirus boettgeri]
MDDQYVGNVSDFIIQGFSDMGRLQFPICITLLMVYLVILMGNATVLLVILLDSHLHTPMYIFLLNLSFLDISLTSNIIPNLINSLIREHRNISFKGCMVQMYSFLVLTCTEFVLLTVMAYDRYIAICFPLKYVFQMSRKVCILFLCEVWIYGFLNPTAYLVLISKLSFCKSNTIDHIFCDLSALLKLSCTDTTTVEILNYLEGSVVTFNTFTLTVTSYIFIISAILKIKSLEGRHKAFSTCASHLTCVVISYLTIISLYMRPTSTYSPKQDKFFALLYIMLIPLLNPIIYTLKNKEFHAALKRLIHFDGFFHF